MNRAFDEVVAAGTDAMLSAFDTTALRLGTSLSTGFGLINRFSEDIDVTVFRNDIGEPATIEELNALSTTSAARGSMRSKRSARPISTVHYATN